MNWKARAITAQPIGDAHLANHVTRGKPVSYEDAVRLVGMVLRARGEVMEGQSQPKTKEVEPPRNNKKVKPTVGTDVENFVSSEDGKTPWSEVMEKAKTDDRLEMAIKEGVVTPVPKSA